jgi:integrase/recombinase XerD
MNLNDGINNAAKLFFEHLKSSEGLSLNTKLSYEGDVQQFLSYLGKNEVKKLKDLNKEIFVKYFHRKKFAGSPSTFRRNISSLRYFLKFIKDKSHINLVAYLNGVYSPKFVRKSRQIVSSSAINELIDSIPQDDFFSKRNKLMIILSYTTGIRVSEVCALKVSDINSLEKKFDIYGKFKRSIPFGDLVYLYLVDYLHERKTFLEKLKKDDSGYLLLSNVGAKLTRQSIYLIVKKYSDKLHVNISPRTLRNSILAHLLEDGADPLSLKEKFGYKSIVPDHSDFSTNDATGSSVYIISNPLLRNK